MTTQVANPPVQSIRLLFSALLLVMLLSALDQTIVSTALPTIVGELGGLDKLSWVVTAYILSSTIAVPLYGKFGDLFGRKIVLQVAIGLFLVGSALCGLAQNMTLATFFATSATSCSAPLITPTLMCFASLPFWSQPTSARPASITAAAARKRNLILFTLSVLTVIVFFVQNYSDFRVG